MSAAPGPVRKVLDNFAVLLSGRAVGGVLGFASTLLAARELGPAGFGIVVSIQAYFLVVRGLVNIKPFEAIVRYGVPLVEAGDLPGLARLLRTSFTLDLLSAGFGVLLAWLGAPLVASAMGWDGTTTAMAAGYGLVLAASGIATASGVLRLYDQFHALRRATIVESSVRLVGVLLAIFIGDAALGAFVLAWALGQLAYYLLVLWGGWLVVREHLPLVLLREPAPLAAMEREHPGIWRFLNVVYWQSSLDLVPKALGTLLAGALLGQESAAMFRIAREFANVVSKPALLVRQAVYPDLARLHHRRDGAFGRVILSIGALMAGPALLLAVASLWLGDWLLAVTVGAEYLPAASLLSWLIGAATLELAAAPLRPAAYAQGRPGTVLWVQVIACGVFVAVFALCAPRYGVDAPGIATSAMMVVSLVGLSLAVARRA